VFPEPSMGSERHWLDFKHLSRIFLIHPTGMKFTDKDQLVYTESRRSQKIISLSRPPVQQDPTQFHFQVLMNS